MVLAFCVVNPSLPVLSLHRFLDHLISLYYLSGPTTIALLLLVCIILPVLVLLNFWLFLSSTGSNFIICGDINVHLDVECSDRSRFNDILQCCSLSQCVSGPTHILGHTLDVLISPCDSDFVCNVHVGDFISDHAAIRCQLYFSHPTTCIEKIVSYRRYHKTDIDQFRNDLSNIPFVLSPGGTAAELYDQYLAGVTQILDKHAPIISRMTKRQSHEWLPDSDRMARSFKAAISTNVEETKDTVEQVKAPQANCLVQSTGQ